MHLATGSDTPAAWETIPSPLVLVETTVSTVSCPAFLRTREQFCACFTILRSTRVERNEILERVLRGMKERNDILRDAIISSNWIEREGGGKEEDCCNEFGENFVEG